MNRVDFIESVNGIQYPEMIVKFFDHFVALKQIVEDTGSVHVLSSDPEKINFCIGFCNAMAKNKALSAIYDMGMNIVIYERPIKIDLKVLTDLSIEITLQ